MTNVLQFKPKSKPTTLPLSTTKKDGYVCTPDDLFRVAQTYRVLLNDPESSDAFLELAVQSVRNGEKTLWIDGPFFQKHFRVLDILDCPEAKTLMEDFYRWRYA